MTATSKTPRRSATTPKKTAAKPSPAPRSIEESIPDLPVLEPEREPEEVKAEAIAPEEAADPTVADLAETIEDITQQAEVIIPDIPEATVETATQVEEQIEQKGTQFMADVMETTKKYTDEAKERFQAAFSEMSEKAKTSVEKSTKALEELNEIAKGNVEALVESGKIASKGMESMGQDAAEYGRVTFEKASAAMKSLAAVKSPTEFFQLQSELLSSVFDSFAKETAKNSESLLKLAGDVVQPISTRVSIVTEKVRSIAA